MAKFSLNVAHILYLQGHAWPGVNAAGSLTERAILPAVQALAALDGLHVTGDGSPAHSEMSGQVCFAHMRVFSPQE